MRIYCILILVLLLISCQKATKDKVITIQPFGNFDPALVPIVKMSLVENYQCKVYILPSIKLPENAFVNIKSPRYRADSLISILKRTKPDSIDHILALTNKDISTSKKENGDIKEPESKYLDWGIFGLGYRPGPSCIVSTYRLRNGDDNLLIDRLKKVSVHELGHNLGLKHCKTLKCVMQDAVEKISTIDEANFELCDRCRAEIF